MSYHHNKIDYSTESVNRNIVTLGGEKYQNAKSWGDACSKKVLTPKQSKSKEISIHPLTWTFKTNSNTETFKKANNAVLIQGHKVIVFS